MALSIWQTCQQDGWPGLVAFLLCLCVDAAAFRAQILVVVVLFLTSETAFPGYARWTTEWQAARSAHQGHV